MTILNGILKTGAGAAVLLAGLATSAWGFIGVGVGGTGGMPGSGELRGPTIIAGRVVCAQCDINDVRAAQPDVSGLYELRHNEGRVVMQIAPLEGSPADDVWWLSDGAIRWKTIAGLADSISVRTPDYLFRQLLEEDNLMKQVRINGLLRTTNTYDVVSLTYLEPTPDPLAFGRRAQEAARRAQAAAARAEAAARRIGEAAARAENAADRLAAMTNRTEEQFTAGLMK